MEKTTRNKNTKWMELLSSKKGTLDYNPSQTFALHVYWILRSPTAAKEMIEKGFKPCSSATKRDSPTTITYLFRIARDQRLAEKFKKEVKKIGDHPHYQPAFKSIDMKIPKMAVEMKLKNGGIDITPLSWERDEPIEGHEKDLDFDPIVLECTEVYLDNQSFYEHVASKEWMNSSAEIWKPSRSLKPKTFCIGTPSEEIWQKALESSLKAVRFNRNSGAHLKDIDPEVLIDLENVVGNPEFVFFLEIDIAVQVEYLKTCRSLMTGMRNELKAPVMIIFPPNVCDDNDVKSNTPIDIRVMLSIPHSIGLKSTSLNLLAGNVQKIEGRIIVFPMKESTKSESKSVAQQFLHLCGLSQEKISIWDKNEAEKSSFLAGYALHPLFPKLTSNSQKIYNM